MVNSPCLREVANFFGIPHCLQPLKEERKRNHRGSGRFRWGLKEMRVTKRKRSVVRMWLRVLKEERVNPLNSQGPPKFYYTAL